MKKYLAVIVAIVGCGRDTQSSTSRLQPGVEAILANNDKTSFEVTRLIDPIPAGTAVLVISDEGEEIGDEAGARFPVVRILEGKHQGEVVQVERTFLRVVTRKSP